MNNNYLISISKFSAALLGFYTTKSKREQFLEQISSFQDFLNQESEFHLFLKDHFVPREDKQKALDILSSSMDEYLINTLHVFVDRNLIFYIDLFLSTLKSELRKLLQIKNIYIYSSFDIDETQKKKIESLWSKKLKGINCNFYYALDKSLKLGIKVQVDTFIEEFSLNASLLDVRLKLDSILF